MPLSLEEIVSHNPPLASLKKVNGVLEVCFIVWFGKVISDNRLRALNSIIESLSVPCVLITESNYKDFEVSSSPIHQGFDYLAGNHVSDYLRAYLLHHYGGGYQDIKHVLCSWKDESGSEWDYFKDEKVWIRGVREKKPAHIGYDVDDPKSKFIQAHFAQLVSMGWVICRSNTKYTYELLSKLNSRLDLKLNELKKYPAEPHRMSGYFRNKPFLALQGNAQYIKGYKYPLRWLELMGEHFHLLMYKYKTHISFGLPTGKHSGYR